MGPITSLLTKLSNAGFYAKTIRIHFRTHDTRPPDHVLARDAPRLTKGLIPHSFKLQLFEWAQIPGGRDFHDRFVLTNAGGVMIGIGPAARGITEEATFTLLADTHAQEIRARFTYESTIYNRIGSVVQVDSDGNVEQL